MDFVHTHSYLQKKACMYILYIYNYIRSVVVHYTYSVHRMHVYIYIGTQYIYIRSLTLTHTAFHSKAICAGTDKRSRCVSTLRVLRAVVENIYETLIHICRKSIIIMYIGCVFTQVCVRVRVFMYHHAAGYS